MTRISCRTARALGLRFYFTGRPCRHGHVAPRFVTNGTCHECARASKRAYARRFTREAKLGQFEPARRLVRRYVAAAEQSMARELTEKERAAAAQRGIRAAIRRGLMPP